MKGHGRSHELRAGHVVIRYQVRFSGRARHRRIYVSPEKVEIVAPRGDSEKALHRIMFEKRNWIAAKLQGLKARQRRMDELLGYTMEEGTGIPFRGERIPLTVHHGQGSRIRVELGDGIHIYRPRGRNDSDLRSRLEKWLRESLRSELDPLVERYASILKVSPNRVIVRDMKTRWGSCSSRGNLSFNLRLIHLHRDVTEYVVAHELCHLRHCNHSRQFWDLLDSVLPPHIPRYKRIEKEHPFFDRHAGGDIDD